MAQSSLREILENRGIAEAADKAGWIEGKFYNTRGWIYPLYRANGSQYDERRFKSAGGKPKYSWPDGRPEALRYYLPPGTTEAIARQKTVYLVGGEPDVLVFHAAGKKNVVSWFGEAAVPDSLPADMRALGAERAIYYFDADDEGLRSAWKVWRLCRDANFPFVAMMLGEIGSKVDNNDLWGEAKHDPVKFQRLLESRTPIDDSEFYIYEAQQMQPIAGQRRTSAGLYDTLAHEWREAWQAMIIAALGPPAERTGRHERWHCPLPSHDDKNPSFRISSDQNPEFAWPVCSCGIQDRTNAWDLIAEAVGVESWSDYKSSRRVTESLDGTPARKLVDLDEAPESSAGQDSGAPILDPDAIFVSRTLALKYVQAELLEQTPITPYEPLIMPYKWLHGFGGFAQLMLAGKVVYILGTSGAGKTTFLECLVEDVLKKGRDVIWWGPEWTPAEMIYRAIHRHGGASIVDINRQTLFRIEEQAGVPLDRRHGELIDRTVHSHSTGLIGQMLQWPGEAYYLQRMGGNLGEMTASIRALVSMQRDRGRKVAMLVIDYAQLLRNQTRNFSRESGAMIMETLIDEIKATVVDAGLIGLVALQSRKADSTKARKGAMLQHGAGQGISDQKANLFLTITPHFYEDEEKTGKYTVAVVKNNLGTTGSVEIMPDLAMLRWPMTLGDALNLI